MLKQWTNLIENYTTRKFTYSSGKLVALAGPAQKIREKSANRYVDGMSPKFDISLLP